MDNSKTTSPHTSSSPLSTALHWFSKGQSVVVATVIETWGSAPCPLGSQLFIREDGLFEGSVSGGCIEGAVIEESVDLLNNDGAKVLEYGVSNEMAWEVGLSCGGTIKILIATLNQQSYETYQAYIKGQKNRLAGYLIHCLDEALVEYKAKIPKIISEKQYFIFPTRPPFQLHIIGAVHMAKHLADVAINTGFAVNVIDPRGAFTKSFNPDNSDIKVINEWPDDALATKNSHFSPPFDDRTALVTLTHDPKLDDPAIKLALKHKGIYIGCLGSKKTHSERVKRLTKAGFDLNRITQIHGPIGLDIGSRGAAEIAISIMAELIQNFRQNKKGDKK